MFLYHLLLSTVTGYISNNTTPWSGVTEFKLDISVLLDVVDVVSPVFERHVCSAAVCSQEK